MTLEDLLKASPGHAREPELKAKILVLKRRIDAEKSVAADKARDAAKPPGPAGG